MPVVQPITGVKMGAFIAIGAPVAHNQWLGIIPATMGEVSAVGVCSIYTRGSILNNGNLAWLSTDTYKHPVVDVCLEFGTTQVLRVPSIKGL